MMNLQEAIEKRLCRICEKPIKDTDFRLTYNFGDEFAHTDCLKKLRRQSQPMTEPTIRDVYFWSEPNGLLVWKEVAFCANARVDKLDTTVRSSPYRTIQKMNNASPTATFTRITKGWEEKFIVPEKGTVGLLWTVGQHTKTGHPIITDMIPAIFETGSVMREENFDAREANFDTRIIDHVELRWESFGPFVAEGFSCPKRIEEVVAGSVES